VSILERKREGTEAVLSYYQRCINVYNTRLERDTTQHIQMKPFSVLLTLVFRSLHTNSGNCFFPSPAIFFLLFSPRPFNPHTLHSFYTRIPLHLVKPFSTLLYSHASWSPTHFLKNLFFI